ncbi:MAG TPA: HAMP domain-containing sensor histidine kinase [Burkholderiales bacterium]
MQPQPGLLDDAHALPQREPALASPAGPQAEFRLVRYFTLTSLAAFIVVAVVLGAVYRHLAIDGLVRTQQEANVNLTRIFANELWAKDFGPFVRAMAGRSAAEVKAAPQIPELHARALALMRGSNVFKVKVYDLLGMTLYSTELKQIGEDRRGNQGVIAAAQGRTLSELVHRNTFSALEQEVQDRDLIQSYIPAFEEGRVSGVFEVYSDATPSVREINRKQWLVAAAVVALLAALYGALFFVVNRAQGIIRQRSRARYRGFIAKAAHELRTPITAIYGFAALLKTRGHDPEVARDVVATIHDQAGRLVQISNDLLDLSRLEARGAQAFAFVRQPLAPILERVAAEQVTPGEARRVQVEVEPGLPELRLDRVKIAQALANILGNAHKFSAPGTPVTLRAFCEKDRVGISVIDRGIGMSADEVGRLFEPFWRADKASEIPGSGLGMALSKEIVQFHDGSIEVHSAPGEGSVVTIWLPC